MSTTSKGFALAEEKGMGEVRDDWDRPGKEESKEVARQRQ